MVGEDKRGPFSWVRRFVKKNNVGGTGYSANGAPGSSGADTRAGAGVKPQQSGSERNGRVKGTQSDLGHNDSSKGLNAENSSLGQSQGRGNDNSEGPAPHRRSSKNEQHTDEHNALQFANRDDSRVSDAVDDHAGEGESRRPVTPSSNTRLSKVQIIDAPVDGETRTNADSTSIEDTSPKFRSNSTFTVPSVARTSMTTVSPSPSSNASTTTAPASLSPLTMQQLHHPESSRGPNALDTASVITIASSSKWHSRRSFDTNASTMALAPESIMSRTESMDSESIVGATGAKSITSSTNRMFDSDPDQEVQQHS